jgi:hypothetical protein
MCLGCASSPRVCLGKAIVGAAKTVGHAMFPYREAGMPFPVDSLPEVSACVTAA